VLRRFTGGADGEDPCAGVVFVNGALYGTTAYGGQANDTSCRGGCGTVFELHPDTRSLTNLHTFSGLAHRGGSNVYNVVKVCVAGSSLNTVPHPSPPQPAASPPYLVIP
jgi:uncharacterized repeat protein (TIGR03803 family)